MDKRGINRLIVFFFIVFGLLFYNAYIKEDENLAQPTKPKPAATKPQPRQEVDWREQANRSGAYVEAKLRMESLLVAPSTAKWPSVFVASDHAIHLGDQVYEVRSWVESQNSFGVPLRVNYYAKVKQVERGEFVLLEFDANR